MAIGPFARILAQIVVPVIAVLARAIPAAYSQALNNAKKAGVDASEAAVPVFGKRISKSEALSILNLTEKEITTDPEVIKKRFDRYFAANASSNKGGSFYLQSKIYRANELLQEFQAEKYKDDIAGKGGNSDKGDTTSTTSAKESSSTKDASDSKQ